MKSLQAVVLLAALSALVVAPRDADGQAAPAPRMDAAQLERLSAGLKQGMSSDEVHSLLGEPRRRSLRVEGNSQAEVANSRLQWTYTGWGDSGPRSLRVDFTSKPTQSWRVSSWEWVHS